MLLFLAGFCDVRKHNCNDEKSNHQTNLGNHLSPPFFPVESHKSSSVKPNAVAILSRVLSSGFFARLRTNPDTILGSTPDSIASLLIFHPLFLVVGQFAAFLIVDFFMSLLIICQQREQGEMNMPDEVSVFIDLENLRYGLLNNYGQEPDFSQQAINAEGLR